MADNLLIGFFTASKVGKTGLTVTVDIRAVSDNTLVVNGGSATEVGGGLYKYVYSDDDADNYAGVFKTADTSVDAQHVPSLASIVLPRIDAAISSRLASSGYTAPDNSSITAIKAQTDNLPAAPAATGDIPTSGVIADAVLDEVFEGSTTLRQALRVLYAVLAGKSSGGGTATITFRDIADSKDRITATVDANGNRTAITLDAA